MIPTILAFIATVIATGFLTFGLAAVGVEPMPVLVLFWVTGALLSRAENLVRLLPSGLTCYGCWFIAALLASLNASPNPRVELARQATVGALLVTGALTALTFAWRSRRHSRAGTWLAAALALGITVAFASSDVGSADPMREWLKQYVSPGLADSAVWLIRKAIHMGFYGLFAWVTLKATRFAGYSGALPAVGVPLAHGIFDELRQWSETRTRLGSPMDVMVDLAGILLALVWAGAFRSRAKLGA